MTGRNDGRRGVPWTVLWLLAIIPFTAITMINLQSVGKTYGDDREILLLDLPRQMIPTLGEVTQDENRIRKTTTSTVNLKQPLTNNHLQPRTPVMMKNMKTSKATTSSRLPSRIFLGIFFSGNFDQLRNLHRRTYLSYFSLHQTSTPDRICTIRQFQDYLNNNVNMSSPEYDETCRMVYTFILEGTETWQKRRLEKVLEREPDVMILDQETYPIPSSPIPSWIRWYQYAMDQRWQIPMDFVAHTDCSVQLYPIEFWKDNPTVFNATDRSKIYATADGFTLVSTDLVNDPILPSAKEGRTGNIDRESKWLDQTLDDVSGRVTPQQLKGITRIPKLNKKDSWLDLLILWDEYKDRKLVEEGGYSDPPEAERIRSSKAYEYWLNTKAPSVPRLLIGIFTMDSPKDKLRRKAIRESYLTYYKSSNTPNRICALQDLADGKLGDRGAECQLAYTFVMGSNPNGTKSLLDPSPTNPIVLDEKDYPPHLVNETDVVHLNIVENMEKGKSPTWIRYATDFAYNRLYFDYVGKMDSDTLLYPDVFLDEILNERCPAFPDNVRVFGGHPVVNPWQNKVIGPMYMGGKMYWMSPDLGRFVTSPTFQRELVDTGAEDWAMGNFVHSHPLPIRRVMFKSKKEGQLHPVKDPNEMRELWNEYYVQNKGSKRLVQ